MVKINWCRSKIFIFIFALIVPWSVAAQTEQTCKLETTGKQVLVWYEGDLQLEGKLCNLENSDCRHVLGEHGVVQIDIDFESSDYPLIFSGRLLKTSKTLNTTEAYGPIVMCVTNTYNKEFWDTVQTSLPALITGFFAVLAGLMLTYFTAFLQNRKKREITIEEWIAEYRFNLENYARVGEGNYRPHQAPALDTKGMKKVSKLQTLIRDTISDQRVPTDVNERKALTNLINNEIQKWQS